MITAVTIPEIIKEYQDRGIFIEMKIESFGTGCEWEAVVHYQQGEDWKLHNCDCSKDWEKAFNSAVAFINLHIPIA